MNGIQDAVAIVTGASSGIGRAAAERFAAEGASVVAADVDPEGGEATVESIRDAGGEATFVETDVSDRDDVDAMVAEAVDRYGGLDFAFNNAGIEGTNESMVDQSDTDWERVIDINLKGVFLGMQAEIPAMLDDGGGAIVNTSSIAGIVGFPGVSPYVASKHGVIGLTKNAALEYGREGVRVNAISPGVIRTPMVERSSAENPEMVEGVSEATPIGRIGEPEEIGDAAVWLCSDDASFVTGETMVIDGGYVSQ
ncbi:SDR family oxidoreductase [Haloplanus aerogenes]|uniref:NAD(P)-dependent dehydrogenase (Short-subunit alcohol dehydrogenase family) n=1 Tax=Haloplanus aerogenes TaxID=660522 RepID=A0A3M0DU03_9EURY|nr:SDR family oxidoreductase [Haloplanus aerogenes]AZH25753.1 SDR family oxidoreductase [Haloplanus aerogenes]RMB25489.1 NAD(P)-dependent dehydrogenase (short-subunit alcohol dehydrogenase family) [Haloplanus aerogenes]